LARILVALALLGAVAVSASGCGALMGAILDGPDRASDDPAAVREAALDQLIERLADPAHEPSGEVILRLSLTGGWDLPGNADLHLSIEDDGRVVRVTDTSVFASTDDYTSMRLTPAGMIRVLEAVRPLLASSRDDLDGGAGVSPTERSALLQVGPDLVLLMDRIGATDGYAPGQQAQRAAFADVIDELGDLAWLGDDIVEPLTPWTPESLTVLAARRGGGGAAAPWPVERSIEDLAQGTQLDPSGEERLVLCLAGSDAAAVFGLLTGVNAAHLPVNDGAAWELVVRPHYPGYRLFSDPCQGAESQER
jgi:hypothetical protein